MWWQSEINLDAETQFRRGVERVVADVVLRFRQPVYGLNGARGMYAAAGERVQREAFGPMSSRATCPKSFPA